jgi:polysaccharide pyruvyl transferase WcaK-like protein
VLRAGLYGSLGGTNSGNEASMASMLAYLREQHPETAIDAMCGDFEYIRDRFGIPAVPLSLYERHQSSESRLSRIPMKVCAKFLDPFRIYHWVGRHDVVLVPGVGILESTLPVRAYGFPLAMTTVAVSGKLRRVPVALVSVGAAPITSRAIRFLSNTTARLVAYRSYRDQYSKQAMQQRGISVVDDHVFPDLVFAGATPPYSSGDSQIIGVGVMDYRGDNDDRDRADEIYAEYVGKMTAFVQWLLDNGYSVRLFGGDTVDFAVAEELLAKLGQQRTEPYAAERIAVERFSSFADLLDKMNACGIVIATRYHNVVGALMLSKPTIAIGYSRKFGALMDGIGMHDFNEYVRELTVERLILKFKEAETRSAEVSSALIKQNAANAASLAQQFSELSALFAEHSGTAN